jgi:hypothetical protein
MGRQRSENETARVPGLQAGSERRPDLRQGGMRAAGIAASRIAAPIVARRGGGVLLRLKAEWAAVVGAELAALTWPEALGRDGALKLRVASNVALELQHRAPLVIERINRYFGRDAVTRLVLVQGPMPLPASPATAAPTPLAREEAMALDLRLDDIADPELRAALARLGRLVLAGERRSD